MVRTLPRRIWIDVTETIATGKWSGIERVVRNLTTHLVDIGVEQGIAVRPVIAWNRRFHALTDQGVRRFGAREPGTAVGGGGGLLNKLITAGLRRVPPLFVLAQAAKKRRSTRAILAPLRAAVPETLGQGDLVLLLDSFWSGTDAIAAAENARRAGATVVSTIYDLIPVFYPALTTTGLAVSFPRTLRRAAATSDGMIAISRQSADDAARFLASRPAIPIYSFRLGFDGAIRTSHPSPEPTRPRRQAFQYAMIGTIEPRKNHDLVLTAFEQRWREGAACELTVVGKIGWASTALLARLHEHDELGKRLHVVHDADDAELARILARTDAVIMASAIEGFGLPIIEALANDIPVLASDIPVFREVAGDAALYFTVGVAASLAAETIRFEREPGIWRAHARAFVTTTWRQSAEEAMAALEAIYARRNDAAGPPS